MRRAPALRSRPIRDRPKIARARPSPSRQAAGPPARRKADMTETLALSPGRGPGSRPAIVPQRRDPGLRRDDGVLDWKRCASRASLSVIGAEAAPARRIFDA